MKLTDPLVLILKEKKNFFHHVVPYEASKDILLLLDFTGNNRSLNEDILNDTIKFTHYINKELDDAKARYGIGGYNEHRIIYTRSTLFNYRTNENSHQGNTSYDFKTDNILEENLILSSPFGVQGAEPRRLHLGIDIWGKPFTKVMAPLDGIVHSFNFNNQYGDYGATIILSHKIGDLSFHTLYGHLSLASLKNLEEGVRIQKADVFAEFGIPQENGNWPPHLHFQIIMDMQGMNGDYPGVCKFSEREMYLENCPDPDLILRMMQYAKAQEE